MKLKKIASLALAGVMAVSMLAGCKSGANSGNDNNGENGGETVVTSTPVVDAVNKGQSASNSVKVEVTADPALDAALAKAISVYGTDADLIEVRTAICNMTGLANYSAKQDGYTDASMYNAETGFLNAKRKFIEKVPGGDDKGDSMDGRVYTLFGLTKYEDVLTEEAALNKAAHDADELFAALAADGLDAAGNKPVTGKKYFGYSYDGNVSMVSVKALDGTTDYYVAFVLNQTVTVKTL